MPIVPSGQQYEITSGEHRAVIVEIGGGVREYTVSGRHVLDPYDLHAICDGAHGTVLVPWANRLADGKYSWDGVDYQVDLTEPSKNNAIHGFLRWRPFEARNVEDDRVTLGATILPFAGYPFGLDIDVEYVVSPDGLAVRTTAKNIGDNALPYASGQHPYLSPGEGLLNPSLLRIAGNQRVHTDDVRQLPTEVVPVEGTPFDFREERALDDLFIDYAFSDLIRDAEGRAWVSLTGVDGKRAQFWVDEAYPYIEVYTGDTLSPARARRGLGCEPMTAPPNAMATGEDIIRLEPGESHVAVWGARLV